VRHEDIPEINNPKIRNPVLEGDARTKANYFSSDSCSPDDHKHDAAVVQVSKPVGNSRH
jgi:hypothetical protein